LRNHKEDIPLLANQFRQRFSRKHGIEVHGISSACMQTLMDHSWPGNVRELQNVIERAVILCNEGGVIESHHLGLIAKLSPQPTSSSAAAAPSIAPSGGFVSQLDEKGEFCELGEIEKRHILSALERSKGNRTHAAKMLGISIRTLRNKLNEYNYKGPSGKGDADASSDADDKD
jgi:two-component system response regulator FlrC